MKQDTILSFLKKKRIGARNTEQYWKKFSLLFGFYLKCQETAVLQSVCSFRDTVNHSFKNKQRYV